MREIPTSFHDDGVFQFEQELAFGQTSIVEFALRVIRDYSSKEQKRIAGLRSPITKVKKIPKKLVMELMRTSAGKITFAPTQLHSFSTSEEHRNAGSLDSFFEHPMPVYCDKETAIRLHAEHCWKVALLNAYRTLEMMGDNTLAMPHAWEKMALRQIR